MPPPSPSAKATATPTLKNDDFTVKFNNKLNENQIITQLQVRDTSTCIAYAALNLALN